MELEGFLIAYNLFDPIGSVLFMGKLITGNTLHEEQNKNNNRSTNNSEDF